MEALIEVGAFSLKTLVVVIGMIVVLVVFVGLLAKGKQAAQPIKVKKLNEKYQKLNRAIQGETLEKDECKKLAKQEKKKSKKDKKNPEKRNKVFVLDFDGDIKASAVDQLRDEISAILNTENACSEIVLRLESPGGMVHSYGLAASQLKRIQKSGIPLTVCVDKVAASGGYMMACVADKIIAAPFAIVGSIGVLAQVPNFNRLLKKHDVDYEEITAGEYKRTISVLGEITEKGREKFTKDIVETHGLFKTWVSSNRSKVKIDEVGTGEHWYGQQVLEKGLVDELMTSDEYILGKLKDNDVYTLKMVPKQNIQEKLQEALGQMISNRLPEWLMAWNLKRHY